MGSEMCIRDRCGSIEHFGRDPTPAEGTREWLIAIDHEYTLYYKVLHIIKQIILWLLGYESKEIARSEQVLAVWELPSGTSCQASSDRQQNFENHQHRNL